MRGDRLLTVTSLPDTHGPAVSTPFLPSVMGSLLELRHIHRSERLRNYITGDTLVHEHLAEIPARFPSIHLALLHLGGTRIYGVLLTMDGKQGVEVLRLVRPEMAVPIHYDDYDVFKSPLEDFQHEAQLAGLEPRIRYVARGETVRCHRRPENFTHSGWSDPRTEMPNQGEAIRPGPGTIGGNHDERARRDAVSRLDLRR